MCDQPQLDWFQQVQQHAPMLFATCWRILKDAQLAEDAVQETYLAAMVHQAEYDPHRPLSTWLLTIAHRTATSLQRKRRVRTRDIVSLPEDHDLAEEAIDAELGPKENAIRTELEDLLNKCCLPGLTNAQREALRLCYHEDLSRSQIAARMGKTENAVGGLLRDGKKRLLAHFQADHPEFVCLFDWSEFNE